MPDKTAYLTKEWVHSHEEDSNGVTVYRPPSFAFPLSRGRSSMHLKKDGTLLETGPGATDRPEDSAGTWTLEAGSMLSLSRNKQAKAKYEIVSASADKLELREKI